MNRLPLVPLLLLLACPVLSAQDPAPDREADKTALRALGARFEAAINQGDLTPLAADLAPDPSAVFLTGDECRGLPAMQAFYDKVRAMLGTGGTYTIKLRPADTDFRGSTAIARGLSEETATTGSGAVYSFETKWTAVLLKQPDGRWLAARLHVSMDPVDNPLAAAKHAAAGWAKLAAGAAAGLPLGWFLARRRRRPSV